MNIFLLLLMCGVLSDSYSYAMSKDPEFHVVAENTLGRPLTVFWTLPSGKKVRKTIESAKKVELTTFDRLPHDAKLHFEVQGSLMRFTAKPIEVDKPELLKQAYALRIEGDGSLVITVSQSSMYLKLSYSYRPLKQRSEKQESVLQFFEGFDAYPDLKKLLNDYQILSFPSYKAALYSQDAGIVLVTAEDIFRYILSVDKEYDHAAIQKALIKIKLRWEGDQKCSDHYKKQRADRILKLAQKAFKELDLARYEREVALQALATENIGIDTPHFV